MKRQRVEGNLEKSPAEIFEEKPWKKPRSEGTSEDKPPQEPEDYEKNLFGSHKTLKIEAEEYEAKYPEIYGMVANQIKTVSKNPKEIAGIVKSAVEDESTLQFLNQCDSLLKEFEQKMNISYGYHAIFLPLHLIIRSGVEAEYDCRLLRELSLVALKFFNLANQGEDFVYHSVVMGHCRLHCGRLFRLTFRARPASSNHNDNDDDVKEFEAEVAYAPFARIPIDVSQCTIKTRREYPLYIEQDDLKIFAQEAIRSFNEEHKGSDFVLHSLGKGDYTPVVGTTFPITFMAKNSNDGVVKSFEAVVKRAQPWVIPSVILVPECFIREEENLTESCKAVVQDEFAVVVEKIDKKTPPYEETCIEEGEKRPCLISVSGMPLYAGKNTKSHEELRWENQGGSQIGTTADNPIPFITATSPRGLTFTFDGNRHNTLALFQRNVSKPSPPCQNHTNPFKLNSAPAKVDEMDPHHEVKDSEEEKRLLPFFVEYQAKLKESDCYLALPVPARFADRISYKPKYSEDILQELAEFVIQSYNNKHGLDFVFHSLIMASSERQKDVAKWPFLANGGLGPGKSLRIAFRARPSKSNLNDEDIKEFRAKVLYYSRLKHCKEMLKESAESAECLVLPERVYPLYFEEEKLKLFAERAIEYYNQQHKGSNMVVRSIVDGSAYSPIPGYHRFVHFKASSDGNEDDIKEFGAELYLEYPWTIPVRDCIIWTCDVKQDDMSHLRGWC